MPPPSRSPPPFASNTRPGLVSTDAQAFSGTKTFFGDVEVAGALTQGGVPVAGGAPSSVARLAGAGFNVAAGGSARLGWSVDLDEEGAFVSLDSDTGHDPEEVMLDPGLYRVDVLVGLSDAAGANKLAPEIRIELNGAKLATIASTSGGSFLPASDHAWAASLIFRVPGGSALPLAVVVADLGAGGLGVKASPETLLQLQRLGA